uniref:Peroxisomal membrane protein 2 n=1 Tax=Phaeomonas parva TaxID=124430 RepID=A0A7S1XVV5_9STRA|mmetsp:Transcript_38589/g.120837  ORF Transcript_38589/g.120837 Transcript_38589/m.120837 type:complete len:198 (+) Transcript_38589:262-855(+)
MPSLGEIYAEALRKKPLQTKALIGFIGAAASNIVAQLSAPRKPGRSREGAFQWGVCFLFALHNSPPLSHFWYAFLERVPALRKSPILKVILDNIIWRPFLLLYSFVCFGLLMGRTPSEIMAELRSKFKSSYLTGLKIYPVASLVNMTMVPVDMRTSFSELVGFFWNWYLSLAFASSEGDDDVTELEVCEDEVRSTES